MSQNPRRNERRGKVERYDRGERVDTMGTNVYSAKDNQSMHKSLNGEFILYQVLVERILDSTKPLSKDHQGIYEYFQPDDPNDQKTMKEFDTEYKAEKAIHWYTRETCIYKILNKALRTQNIDDVAAFSQFVRDLYQQLQQERKKFAEAQKSSILTVFRGQFISKDEVNRLKSTKGELLSVNSFLSTSTNKQKALEFATSRPPPNDQLVSILLEINVNIKSPSKPLADIKHFSAFAEEEEILFMFGCIFRIDDVWFDEENQLWRARFTLCSDGDTDLKEFLASLTQELEGKNRLVALGDYFIQMQKYEDAEEHYLKLLDEDILNDPFDFAYCHQGLAHVYDKKADYKRGIEHLDIAIDFILKAKKEKEGEDEEVHPLLSECYNDLGSLNTKLSNYPVAFQFYEKAMKTKNNILSNTYIGLAKVQFHMNNYQLSLEYLEKALENEAKTNYSSIANIYIELGQVYGAMNSKEKASDMFDKALESQLHILNEDHPDLGYTYLAIASLYTDINEFDKAHQYLDKTLQLQLKSLPNNHSDFASTYTKFGDLYFKQDNYDQALDSYHKALENQLKTLLWNHPLVANTYITIGLVHWKTKNYAEALVYFHKVLDSELERKRFGDTSLSRAFKRLGDLYFEKGDTDQALVFYLQYLDNELESKLYEDMSLSETYKNIAAIYYKKRSLSDALLHYNRLLDCYLRKQPIDENEIDETYASIGKVYLKKKNFDESLLFYQNKSKKLNETKLTNGKRSSSDENEKVNSKKNNAKDVYREIDNKHFEKRHLDQAWNYFEKYLEKQLNNLEEKDPFLGDTYQILGNLAFERKDYQQALAFFLKLLKNKLTRRKIDDSSLANIYTAIGSVYLEDNQLNLSLIYFNRLIDCKLKKRKSFEHQSVIDSYRYVAKVYLAKHHFKETLNFLNRSLIQSQTNVLQNTKSQSNLSNLQFEKRHLESALRYFHPLLEKHFKKQSNHLYSLEDLYIIIGNLFFEKQDSYRSLTYFEYLINYQLKRNPQGDSKSINTYAVMGNVYLREGQSDSAAQNYRQAIYLGQRNISTNRSLFEQLKEKLREILLPNVF